MWLDYEVPVLGVRCCQSFYAFIARAVGRGRVVGGRFSGWCQWCAGSGVVVVGMRGAGMFGGTELMGDPFVRCCVFSEGRQVQVAHVWLRRSRHVHVMRVSLGFVVLLLPMRDCLWGSVLT